MLSRTERVVVVLYVVWALLTIVITWLKDAASADNVTRLLVTALLAAQLVVHVLRRHRPPVTSMPWRYVLGCCWNAALVECCYMISKPLYPSLTITRDSSLLDAARVTAIDLALTFPAFVVIFHAAWALIRRYRYSAVEYGLLFGLGQALGDGGAVTFAANPGLLVFAPWLMLNYHASNLTPYLRIHDELAHAIRSVDVMCLRRTQSRSVNVSPTARHWQRC